MIDTFAHNLGKPQAYPSNRSNQVPGQYGQESNGQLTPGTSYQIKVWLKKSENYVALPFYKLITRKYESFKVIGVG